MLKRKDHLGDPRRWRIILKRNANKYDMRMWSGLIWLRVGTSKYRKQLLSSIKDVEFLDQLGDY
jgi:hypothetical protein